jgi:Ca2+-binding EF-hand superfamily protein
MMTLAGAGPARSERAPADWAQAAQATQVLLGRLQPGATLDSFQQSLRSDFVLLDADADGRINARDVELHALMEAVQTRTQGVTFVLRYDLDGDGAVTEDEIRRMMRYELRTQLAQAGQKTSAATMSEQQINNTVQKIMALDTDKDGKVSISEAGQYPSANGPRYSGGGQSARTRQLLEAVGTDEVTLQDYQAFGEALFRKIDGDGNGTISQQEYADYIRSLQQTAAAKKEETERAGCELPAASEKAKVVLLSAYQTEAASNVTLGSQDVEVGAGRIIVEAGSEPLYIVLTTYRAAIWQVTGAVERVERLVLSSAQNIANGSDQQRPSLAGATGLPTERVSFPKRPDCMRYFSDVPTSESLLSGALIRRAAGKAPDLISAKYAVSVFSVPSGKIDTVRDERQSPRLIIEKHEGKLTIIGNSGNVVIQTGPSRARDEMNRFFPGGVAEIDPKAVVGSAPAEPYETLPSQAGLVQLLATGALTENRAGEYIVRKKIRFPSGLGGAHAVTFLIMKGTPYPEGDPGHSCVIVEESGESKGAICPRR